jgi:hypothetical protein
MFTYVVKRMVACALLVTGLAVLAAAANSRPISTPENAQIPAGPVVYWSSPITITPSAPPVGTYYDVAGMVHSRHNRPLMIRATIEVPPRDVPTVIYFDRRIEANGDMGFLFTVYCGEPGGQVRVKIDILREL